MHFSEGEVARYRLEPGDVLVNEASGSATEVGKPARWQGEIADCCFQNTLIRVRPREGLDSRFVEHRIRYEALRGGFARGSRGVGIHHLSARTLTGWPFEVPPLAEQRDIVQQLEQALSHLESGKRALGSARRRLDVLRRAVLDAAVRGRLTEQDPADEPGEVLLKRILENRRQMWEQDQRAKAAAKRKTVVGEAWKQGYTEPAPPLTAPRDELPQGWTWASLDQLAAEIRYGTSVKCRPDADGPAVLRIPNVKKRSVDLADLKYASSDISLDGLTVAAGDLLIIRTNGSPGLIGRTAVVPQDMRSASFASYLIRIRLAGDVDARFVSMVLESPTWRQVIAGRAASSAGQYNLSAKKLRDLTVVLPPVSEQGRIVAEAERRLSLANASGHSVDRALVRAGTLRRSLLHAAFTGRFLEPDIAGERPQAADTEPTHERLTGAGS